MCDCCDCASELRVMRGRTAALASERAHLYHELGGLKARYAAMNSTTRITEQKTRGLSHDLLTSARAGAYLILRNQLKGPDMSQPIIYTVIERQTTQRIHPGEAPSVGTKVKLTCEEPPARGARGVAALPSSSHLHATIELSFHSERDAAPYEPGRRFALVPVVDAPPAPLAAPPAASESAASESAASTEQGPGQA